ncbi:MAG: 1-(5-phosphoribosyl)-5-[(5-phosphoribosylamino)methylideneamino]imidazole-4-carboxamide isomerase [Phocaeicola sp.]|uniref:1-(5-phosphoribosyl)-5-[(5- phosphoribosylamino)methylideneamino]imidazole-4- carboxamide isomerase n=1 Tax=Phocaeicola sp. TaxID=2773926 RepID=UPI003FA13E1A
MIEIIPAIDIIEGKCVRLSKGDYNTKKIYNENPLEVAKEFETNGIRRLHVVDLDGAASQHIINYKVLDLLAGHTSLTIDFGGGIKTDEDLQIAFDNGAMIVTLGSVAVKQPELLKKWLQKYGSEKLILGADVKDGNIAINGWKEESQNKLMPFLEHYTKQGVSNVLCTDIERDGMLQGPAISLYKDIIKTFPKMHLIASGGVGKIEDIYQLEDSYIPAVVLGKALYEGTIKFVELKPFINN